MENHYICTGGCGGVSDIPGECQASGCPKHGQSLEPCTCLDGEHGGMAGVDENFPESGENGASDE